MKQHSWPRPASRSLFFALVASLLLGACDEAPADPQQARYEVWALDQGTNITYIYDARRELVDTIDFNDHGVVTPHMIAFSSRHDYAVVASTSSGNVAVIRAADREVLQVIPTGPSTHMASFTPDDRAILVDVIGSSENFRDGTVLEIQADLGSETFTLGRSLTLADDPLIADNSDDFADTGPVCHEYGPNGTHAFITLGPGLANGGLVVLDTQSFELAAAFGPEVLPVNCGTMPNADRSRMVVNGGSADVGHWYVLDTTTFQVVHDDSSRGADAHGVWLSPDGREFWMVNRVSKNGIVIDAESFEVIDEVDEVGGTPDIMAMDPAGELVFVSLRGPNPRSAAHVAVGHNPGFAVLDARTRQLIEVIEPDQCNDQSDFHGIAVRRLPD
jgi:DNA-binding beta-propeller fold protein YncE